MPPGVPERHGEPSDHRLALLVIAALGVRMLLRVTALDEFVDDAYIHFRFADALAQGHAGYNPGEAVLGYTSPLYVLVLAAGAAVLGADALVGTALVIDLACVAGATILLARLAGRLCPRPALVLVPWCLALPFVDGSLNGMETTLFLVLTLGAWWAVETGRTTGAAAIAGVAVLCRPEGAVVVAAVLGTIALRDPRRIGRCVLALAAVVLPWACFAVAAYGTVLAQPLRAKSAALTAGIGQAGGPVPIASQLQLGISSDRFARLGGSARVVLQLVAIVVLVAIGRELVRAVRSRSTVVIPAVVVLGTTAAYALGRPVRIWSWYSVPTALATLWCIAGMLGRSTLLSRHRRPATAAVAVAALATLVVGVDARRVSHDEGVETYRRIVVAAEDAHVQLGTVMTGDIGLVGWRTGARIIDLAGLVSPATVTVQADGFPASVGALAATERPDLVILSSDPLSAGTVIEGSVRRPTFRTDAERAAFVAHYRRLDVGVANRVVFVRVP